MEYNNVQTAGIGYVSSATVTFLHFEDIIMALALGFFGAAGAWLFKLIVEKKK